MNEWEQIASTDSADEDEQGFDDLFQPESDAAMSTNYSAWKLLVVDDEDDVYAMMRLALGDLRIKGRSLELIHAATAEQALGILRNTRDFALILLDVVMESHHAGLDLARAIREELGNHTVQIAIVTGQPGYAPEQEVMENYDINDYRLKSELSVDKLRTLVYSALRAYATLQKLLDSRERLEHTAKELELAKQRYEDLYDGAPDMYVSVDAHTALIIRCNETLVSTLGYADKTDIIGRPIFDMYHKDSHEKAQAAFRTFVETGSVKNAELQLLRADGRPLDVSLNVKAIRDKHGRILHSHSAWRDITEWVKARARLAAAEERNRLLLESVTEGIIGVDTEGCCTFINPAGLRILGFQREEMLGRPIHPLIHHTHADGCSYEVADCPMTQSFAKGQEVSRDDEVLWRKDGSSIYAEYTSVPFQKDDKTVGAVIIFHDISARRNAEEKIKYLAFHDPLTGLANRTMFSQALNRTLQHMQRDESRCALHLVDLDHFKDVNDSLGHPMGDRLLVAVAERIRDITRSTDVFARLGGDEFGLLQTHLGDISNASVMAAKIIQTVSGEYHLDGHEVRTNASVGIVIPEPGDGDADELMSRADVALYKAKESGRGTLAFFEDTMNRQLMDEMRINTELSRAIDQDEFYVVYQPQIDLQRGELIGLEALVRWRHPRHGIRAPGEFIGVAEKRGHIAPISDLVLRKVCAQIARWKEKGLDPGRVAVNLCAQQLAHPDFADKVLDTLEKASVDTKQLELEFTETVLIAADLRTQADIARLSEYGVRFAIDDFGTGFSSLQYLRKFHADKLKIDREFICDVVENSSDAEIVKATIALGNALGLETIAEGVETEGQADFLRKHGCRQAQGYLFSRPLEADEIERHWLRKD